MSPAFTFEFPVTVVKPAPPLTEGDGVAPMTLPFFETVSETEPFGEIDAPFVSVEDEVSFMLTLPA